MILAEITTQQELGVIIIPSCSKAIDVLSYVYFTTIIQNFDNALLVLLNYHVQVVTKMMVIRV